MKLLLEIKEQDIKPEAPITDISLFDTREASRAIVLDDKGGVFLLKVGKHDYHKLPGGGIDEGEDIRSALARELMEEIGCVAEIIDEVGMIIEYRDEFKLKQTSYCFLAKQTGIQVPATLEEGEIEEGLYEVKAKSIDEAIALLESDAPNNYEGLFIKLRDITLLKAAKRLT